MNDENSAQEVTTTCDDVSTDRRLDLAYEHLRRAQAAFDTQAHMLDNLLETVEAVLQRAGCPQPLRDLGAHYVAFVRAKHHLDSPPAPDESATRAELLDDVEIALARTMTTPTPQALAAQLRAASRSERKTSALLQTVLAHTDLYHQATEELGGTLLGVCESYSRTSFLSSLEQMQQLLEQSESGNRELFGRISAVLLRHLEEGKHLIVC